MLGICHGNFLTDFSTLGWVTLYPVPTVCRCPSHLDALVLLPQVSAAGAAAEGDRGGQEDDEAGPPGDELAIAEKEGLEATDDSAAE